MPPDGSAGVVPGGVPGGGDTTDPRPMFPLGTVLFPHETLDLQIFEPRYRALLADCLDGDGRFGVVLIARGSEVGGGDVRTEAGTMVRVVAAGRLPGDRIGIRVVGESVLRVVRWLPDDPYPRAKVELVPTPDGAGTTGTVGAGRPAASGPHREGPVEPALARAVASVRRARWLLSELGVGSARFDPLEGVPSGGTPRGPVEADRAASGASESGTDRGPPGGSDGDREVTGWRVCAAAPLGSFDRQTVLAAPTWTARLEAVVELSESVASDAAALLAGEGTGEWGPDTVT